MDLTQIYDIFNALSYYASEFGEFIINSIWVILPTILTIGIVGVIWQNFS